MRPSLGVSILLLLTVVLQGAGSELSPPADKASPVGVLTPVAVQTDRALGRGGLYAYDARDRFPKRTEGDGTVSEHARIATVKSRSLVIKVAIDSKTPDAKAPDVVRFDFTGRGKFDDKAIAPLKGLSSRGRFRGNFGPETIHVQLDGKTIPIMVNGSYRKNPGYRSLTLSLATGLEGSCRFGENIYRVRLIDGDNNLRCGDEVKVNIRDGKVFGIVTADTLLIDMRGGSFKQSVQKAFYGQRVKVDGKWYEVKISSDESKISATQVEVETGQIRVPHERWSATLIGTKYLLDLSGGAEAIEVPADQYVFRNYSEFGTGRASRARFRCAGTRVFDVPAGQVTEIAIGSPLTASVGVHIAVQGTPPGGRPTPISLKLTDASGTRISSLTAASGRRPPAPRFEILDASGKKVYGGVMKYG